MTEYLKDPASVPDPTILSRILNQVEKIEAILEGKSPYWEVDEALEAFESYLRANHRVPENFDYPLRVFRTDFTGRNVAEITPAEIEGFLGARWGTRKSSTIRKRKDQIAAFFRFCIREFQKRGSPPFPNPCNLADDIRARSSEREGFIPVERMLELLETFEDEKHWLMVAIQMTAGLRIGEVLKLTPADVDDRVLTLRNPKSGKAKELAVVPQSVADRLEAYISTMPHHTTIFQTTRQSANRILKRHAEKLGLDLTTHDLRRWCATFWERKGDMAMVRFVLRHSGVRNNSGEAFLDSLSAKYVSALDIHEAIKRQNAIMDLELSI